MISASLVCLLLDVCLLVEAAGCSSDPGPPLEPCPTESGTGCAPLSDRVDLYQPTFSNPTRVTNRLYPVSDLRSVVFTGHVDGAPFRTETTLLPETKTIAWNGQQIETVVQQYMAFSDGRIQEIAIDWFAQDDSGAVWYFGEDVSDFDETGTIYTHEGTWLVDVDGALAMNMPRTPEVGKAWLAENAAPAAWEQIIVKSVGEVRDGPAGKVSGVVVTEELKLDGGTEEKVFAPGYGEFSTGNAAKGSLEALALAVPTDALSRATPEELPAMAANLLAVFNAAETGDWSAVATALSTVGSKWTAFRASTPPPRLEEEMIRLLGQLEAAVGARDADETRQQAIAAARVASDFRLRYEPVPAIDTVRLDLWFAQILADADAPDIKGDAATAALVWDRIAKTFDPALRATVEGHLESLRSASEAADVARAKMIARQLRDNLGGQGWQ
ncbi:MAG: hypothetical protein IT384_03855 [Deltaproteobacteria bacterium]|nr:hypothetical protein [Deltaproteobacteria bacterium]